METNNVAGLYSAYNYVEVIELMPRIELCVTILPEYALKVAGSYVQTAVMANNPVTLENDRYYGINAFHVLAAAKPAFEAGGMPMYVTPSGFYSVNGGIASAIQLGSNYALANTDGNRLIDALPTLKNINKAEFDDTTVFGGALAFGISPTPEGTVELGFGYQSASNDSWDEDATGMAAYLNYSYKISPNFTITPEVAYIDCGDNRLNGNVKEPKIIQVGAQLKMDI